MKIFELSKKPEELEKAIQYFWNCSGNNANLNFYEDCIRNSLADEKAIPKFYIGIEENEIVGSYALLANDLISRQDLFPWLACLYVNESHRKKGYALMLLEHGLKQTQSKGYEHLYLSTDLINFYERKGWEEYAKGYNFGGQEFKIYAKETS